MVEETNFNNRIVFKCMKCGWMYKDKKKAQECENYCKEHNACNIKFVKYAIKIK
jgi:hypothetical protein